MTKDREDLVKASAMTRLLAENQRLRAALESLRRRHELHDNWESCPLAIEAPGPDYRDRYGDRPAEPRRCTCGADEANTIIDEALAASTLPEYEHHNHPTDQAETDRRIKDMGRRIKELEVAAISPRCDSGRCGICATCRLQSSVALRVVPGEPND